MSPSGPVPDIDVFEELATIIEYDGDLSRKQAEDLAAKDRASKMPISTGSGWRTM